MLLFLLNFKQKMYENVLFKNTFHVAILEGIAGKLQFKMELRFCGSKNKAFFFELKLGKCF